jgi:hypothetical protein
MLYDLKPRSDFVRSTTLDDVLVEGEHDIRRELACPCVQVLDQSVFFKTLVPIRERAGIDLVLPRKVELCLYRQQLEHRFFLDAELLKRNSRLSLEERREGLPKSVGVVHLLLVRILGKIISLHTLIPSPPSRR